MGLSKSIPHGHQDAKCSKYIDEDNIENHPVNIRVEAVVTPGYKGAHGQ